MKLLHDIVARVRSGARGLWNALALADQARVAHPAEAEALRRLIDASDDLGGERRAQALALLDGPPDVKLDEVQALSPVAREGVYRAALGIVRLDGKVTADEEEWVAKLSSRLHLDETILKKIEAER